MADFEKVIPPGREGKIDVKIDGKKLFPGLFEKNFVVNTNDSGSKQFTLTVQGTVRKVFDFSRQLSWTGFTDDELKFDVDITNLLATPITIKSVRWAENARNKDFTQKLDAKLDAIEKGRKYHLRISEKKRPAYGSFIVDLVLATDYPKLAEKTISITFVIRSDVELLPDKLYFGEMLIPYGATKAFDKEFRIVAARGDSLEIIKAVPSRDDISVKIQELQPGKTFMGTVWVRPQDRMGLYTGSIKIYTNYPKCKELTLDINGSVRVGNAVEGAKPGVK
ncbi:MAG: hypothetical protein PHD74_03360 [Candidatus Krumholzibacteria bacterium]|nr:hypothetical protein [Candidatus Krumholzibacteria bacterium]